MELSDQLNCKKNQLYEDPKVTLGDIWEVEIFGHNSNVGLMVLIQ